MSPLSRQRRAWLGTLALCALAAGLLLVFAAQKEVPSASPILAHADAVQGLTLSPAGGEAIVFVRAPEAAGARPSDLQHPTFEIVSPRPTPADTPRVKALLALLVALGSGEPVEPGETDEATFGLDAPVFRLELDLGDEHRLLELGRASPFDGRRYLRLDGEQLRLVSDGLLRRLDSRLIHWREKRIVPGAPESIDRLVLHSRSLAITLERRGENWFRIETGGEETSVNARLARALVRDLTEVRAVAFELEAADGLPPEGTPAEATIRVGRGEQQSTFDLHGLGEDDDPGVLARGTPLSPWVRLRPGAWALLFGRFSALAAPAPAPSKAPD